MATETIADILREMRSRPFNWSYPEGIPQMHRDNEEVRAFADRIEAVMKREMSKIASKNGADFGQLGNMAAMREALVLIANTAECLEASLRRDNVWDEYIQDAGNIRNIARAALSAPPRNCDLYKTESKAYQAWLKEMMKIPIEARVYFESWLFAEAKGANDEQ